jgi:hypothetical protein
MAETNSLLLFLFFNGSRKKKRAGQNFKLTHYPDAKEVCVKKVYPLRFADDPSHEKYFN